MKTDLKTHKRGGWREREREAPEAAAVALSVFLLSFFTACPTDVQDETRATTEQRPGGYHVCLIKNDTLSEVSANKQTIGIIRRPTVIRIQMSGVHPDLHFII